MHSGLKGMLHPSPYLRPPLLQVPGCRSALRNGQSDCTAQAAGERTLLAEGLETAMAPVPAERVGPAHHCLSPRVLHTAHVSPEGLWLHTEDGGGSFRTPSRPPPHYKGRDMISLICGIQNKQVTNKTKTNS